MATKPVEEIGALVTQPLRGRNILLGVTGSSAIYKSIDLARRLIRMGATVRVIMTRFASKLVSPDLFHWATGSKPYIEMTGETEHIDLAKWADALVVAPATLNTMSKMAFGVLDELLTLTAAAIMGEGKRVVVVPAMNIRLYKSPQYARAERALREMGVVILPPKLEEDRAKYPPIEDIAHCVDAIVNRGRDLEGLRVLVTAGATRERIDPVRVVTNPSSGLMGVLVAREAACRGAEVTLIHGHLAVEPPYMVETVPVETTEEMASAVREVTGRRQYDVAVFAAAPADYRPSRPSYSKLSTRETPRLTLELEATPKVAKSLSRRPRYLAIFVAETVGGDQLVEKARDKMIDYNADLAVGNNVLSEQAGFAKPLLDAVVLSREGVVARGLLTKHEVARLILDKAVESLRRAG
jgi:phosphopantothenoylcysteine decarboxylase/phosphopantothenate--cysteine ligase